MGYSYFCPYVVYGFRDVRNGWGDGKTLEREPGPTGIDVYAGEINKGYNICSIIGIQCGLAGDGTVFIHNEAERQTLMEFMEDCKAYYVSIGIPEDIIRKVVVPSYHLVVSGDWECHDTYRIPGYELNY
jgi:hypothetical protein